MLRIRLGIALPLVCSSISTPLTTLVHRVLTHIFKFSFNIISIGHSLTSDNVLAWCLIGGMDAGGMSESAHMVEHVLAPADLWRVGKTFSFPLLDFISSNKLLETSNYGNTAPWIYICRFA